MGKDQNSGGWWFPNEGYAVTGKYAGSLLTPIVRLHCTWQEWRELHPDTTVIALPHDPKQRDVRGGHGAEEYWARPGLDNFFLPSLDAEELDRRLPENEMVIAVNVPEGSRTYPLNHLHCEGRVLNDDIGGRPIAVFCGPEQDSMKMTTWDRGFGDDVLDFEWSPRGFIDSQTSTVWSIEGKGVAGPHEGEQLTPIYNFYTRYHSWCYVHPTTEVWKTSKEEAPNLDLGIFEPAIAGWRESGYDAKVERAIINTERPLESDQGLIVHIGGHRHRLHHFLSVASAEDYMLIHSHSVRRGHVVLESEPEPEKIFKDIGMQRERYPDHEIEWSPLLDDEEFLAELDGIAPGNPEIIPIRGIIDSIVENGEYAVYPGIATPMAEDTFNMLPLLTLTGRFAGVEDGMYISIEEDPFVVYRFESAERAEHYVDTEEDMAFAVDRYVFRSIPINMFKLPRFAMTDRPQDKVNWSEFLEDDEFKDLVREIITSSKTAAEEPGEGA
jgi:hypothetical protein